MSLPKEIKDRERQILTFFKKCIDFFYSCAIIVEKM